MDIEQMGGMVVSIQDLVNTEPNVRTIVLNAQTTRMALAAPPVSRRACALQDRGAPSIRPTREQTITVSLRDGLFRRTIRVARA